MRLFIETFILCVCVSRELQVNQLFIVKRTDDYNKSKYTDKGLTRWLSDKESAYNAGDAGSIPGMGRSPGEGNGNPGFLSWEIPRTEDPGRLQSMGVAKNQT